MRNVLAPFVCGTGIKGIYLKMSINLDFSSSLFFISYCLEFLLEEVMDLLKSALRNCFLLVKRNYSILQKKKRGKNIFSILLFTQKRLSKSELRTRLLSKTKVMSAQQKNSNHRITSFSRGESVNFAYFTDLGKRIYPSQCLRFIFSLSKSVLAPCTYRADKSCRGCSEFSYACQGEIRFPVN